MPKVSKKKNHNKGSDAGASAKKHRSSAATPMTTEPLVTANDENVPNNANAATNTTNTTNNTADQRKAPPTDTNNNTAAKDTATDAVTEEEATTGVQFSNAPSTPSQPSNAPGQPLRSALKKPSIHRKQAAHTTLIVAPPKTKANQRVETCVEALQCLFKIVQSIDDKVILHTYDETPMDEIDMANALFGGSATQFPTSLITLKKFFGGLHIRDSPKLHLNLRIGTDKDPKDLVSSGDALLQDALDSNVKESCNANWYMKHLQVPCAEDCGWIAGLFYNCKGNEIEKILQDHLDACTAKGKIKIRIPVSVRLKNVRQGGSATKKSDNKSNDMSARTCHVEVPRGTKKTASRFIHITIKKAKAFTNRTNLKLTWVPVVDKDSSPGDTNYSKEALAHHKSLVTSAEFSYVPGIENLDITAGRLNDKSLRKILLGLKLPSDDSRNVFILAETGFNGETTLHYAKKWAAEARQVIKHLLLYLRRKCADAGNAVEKGFSLEAIEEAEDHIWDEEKNRPTSQEARDLEARLASAKESTAGWVIEGMSSLDEDDTDEKTDRPNKKKKPGWEDASFKSRGAQEDVTAASEPGAASPSDAVASAEDSSSAQPVE